ncbi:MAG: MAPEG family protein [Pseudomonadota bacterium]
MTMIEALVALGALTFFALGIEIFFTYGSQGLAYGFSSNRPPVTFSPLARRISRVYGNQVEAAAYMVPILGAAALVGLDSPLAQTAALAIVLGRIWFALSYYIGFPFVRILGFLGGSLGTLTILVLLVQDLLRPIAL